MDVFGVIGIVLLLNLGREQIEHGEMTRACS